MPQGDNSLNRRAAEILLDRLIDAVAELQDRLDKLEEIDAAKHTELHSEILSLKRICDEMKVVLDYKETIVSLGRNASAEGVIGLVKDVEELKVFMNKQKERQELISKILLSAGVPLTIFLLGTAWYVFTHYLMK